MGLYKHIGPRVESGDVLISGEEAEIFRKTTLKGSKINKLIIDDEKTLVQTSSFTSGFMSDAAADYDVYSSAFYAKRDSGVAPNFWRSVISFARFNMKHSDTKIYNIYEVESYEGELARAVRQVRVVRNLSRIAFDADGNPFDDTYSRQHKAFEKPMMSEDVETVDRQVESIVKRYYATSGR